MNISRIDSGVIRARVVDAAAGPHAFVVGQQMTGRVVEILSDRSLLLTLGSRQVIAQSSVPLQKGQAIAVSVTKGGPTVELKLQAPVLPDQPNAQRNYELASMLNALGQSVAPSPGYDQEAIRAVLGMLSDAAAASALKSSDANALQRMFQPLMPGADREAMAVALKQWLKNSGMLFEARVREVLAADPQASPEKVMEALAADLKVIVARIMSAVENVGAERVRGHSGGGYDSVAALIGHKTGQTESSPAWLAERLLAQQAEFAYRWVADGVVAFEVPVNLPEETAQAHVRFHREPTEKEGTPGPAHIDLFVETARLGPIAASARWMGRAVDATVVVEREPARDVLLARVDELKEPLGTMFARVSVDVLVGRVRRPSRTDSEHHDLPGGSVLSVRA